MIWNWWPDKTERTIRRLLKKVKDKIQQLEMDKESVFLEIHTKLENWRHAIQTERSTEGILEDVFAHVYLAIERELGYRPHDEQVMAGIVMVQGDLAEMKTGEGKTTAALFPAVWFALRGEGVHIITVNPYLAARDAAQMAPVFQRIGLSTGCVLPDQYGWTRKQEYAKDITYTTHTEAGFDFLRDQIVLNIEDRVQRGLVHAIIDEADSVLIDEARTPLILSGMAGLGSPYLLFVDQVVRELQEDRDFTIDERNRRIDWTDEGLDRCEALFHVSSLMDEAQTTLHHAILMALRAQHTLEKDVDYVVQPGQKGEREVILVDKNTGRLMHGRRLQDGLHQALEAKERISIQGQEGMLAQITIQHFFRRYHHLCGMTGTALPARDEFLKTYNQRVVVIPTHRPMIRQDLPDRLFVTAKQKWAAVLEEIIRVYATGQPMLVGTQDIRTSEQLSGWLDDAGIPHRLLNAKKDEEEAAIIAGAGQWGAVTLSTNMAGRGVDIKLGEGVAGLGGLYVIGTTRFESARIDWQLRGRSGRQGDPGKSCIFLSLEDDLIFRYASDPLVEKIRDSEYPEDGEIKAKKWHERVHQVQESAEREAFEVRQMLLAFDDVTARHREWIYQEREKLLVMDDMKPYIRRTIHRRVQDMVYAHCPYDESDTWDMLGLMMTLTRMFPPQKPFRLDAVQQMDRRRLLELIIQELMEVYLAGNDPEDPGWIRSQRQAFLRTIDSRWIKYMEELEELKKGILLRAYGQESPVQAYVKETAPMLEELMIRIQEDAIRQIWEQLSPETVLQNA